MANFARGIVISWKPKKISRKQEQFNCSIHLNSWLDPIRIMNLSQEIFTLLHHLLIQQIQPLMSKTADRRERMSLRNTETQNLVPSVRILVGEGEGMSYTAHGNKHSVSINRAGVSWSNERRGAGEVGLEAREEVGGPGGWGRVCATREGRDRAHGHPSSAGGEKWPLSPAPGTAQPQESGKTGREWGPCRPRKDGVGASSRSPSERAEAVPAALPAPERGKVGPNGETRGYLSQLPAHRSPLPQTQGYHGRPRPRWVTSPTRARAADGLARPLGRAGLGHGASVRRRRGAAGMGWREWSL